MHNDTPLGTTMHFKELDRQAALLSRPLRHIQSAWRLAAISVVAIGLLQRLRTVGSWSRGRAKPAVSG